MSESKEEILWLACLDGDLEEVTLLCSDPAVNINWEEEGGYTPLSGACVYGHAGVVKHLLSLGD